MNPIKTLIVEDEKHCEMRLLELLLESHAENIQIIGVARSIPEAESKINSLQPKLIFLDVKVGNDTSLNLLPKIDWQNIQIIFTTSYQSYMDKAFEFSAIHYLLKPIEKEMLDEAMRRVYINGSHLEAKQLETLQHNKENTPIEQIKITISNADGKHVLRLGEIVHCKSDVNYTTFYLENNKKLTVSKPLKYFDDLLSPYQFFRTHQSHLVNMNKIKKYLNAKGGYILMTDGIELEVSTRRKVEFLKALEDRI